MSTRKLIRTTVLPALFCLLSNLIYAQTKTVNGQVADSSGAGLQGITVSAKGSKIATTTNGSGQFSITVPAATKALIFTSVGFQRREISIADQASINVTLQTAASSLNEVVVVGYGTVRKKDLTGSVAIVSAKDFQKGVITTPEQLISGKVAGVSIVSNGGAPGSGSTIRIRGGSSLNASNDPLIVIDGVPLSNEGISGAANPLSLINPNDIESFSVLKDASAAAIYGSRASNGVIIITTKKGRQGKPTINFSTQFSVAQVEKTVDVLSADQLTAYVKTHGSATQAAILGNANTNWQNLIYQTALAEDNNISISGALKKLPYRVSVGFLNQDGVLKTDNLKRTTASVNLSPSLLDDHLKINLNLKGSLSNTRFANQGAIGAAVTFDPTQPVYSGNNRYGGYFQWLDPNNATTGLRALAPLNPMGLLMQRDDKSQVQRSIGNIQFDYKLHFLPDLHANVNLGYDVSKGQGTVVVSDSAAASYKRFQSPAASGNYFSGVNTQYLQKKSNTLLEAYLNYVKELRSIKSHIDVVAGYSYQDFSTTNYNYADYSFNGTKNPGTDPTYLFDIPENRLISFYGRLNYGFNNKYLFTATVRRDGSSRFGPSNRWGTFPSAALAWKIKDESFLKNARALSDLKLRVGYGVTGQQEGIGNYDYISYYNLSGTQAEYQLGDGFYQMFRPGGYYQNRKWEQTATYNAALDYGFLNNRINGSLEFYYKKTTDLLSLINQPGGSNFSNKVVANIGDMENKGVEFTINTEPVRTRDLTWNFNFNVTYNQNKITNLTIAPDPSFIGNQVGGISGGTGQTIQINAVGYPRASFYTYQQVYNPDGTPIDNVFVDRNGDGTINEKDLYEYKSPDPKVFFGISSNVTYRKWSGGFVMRANIDNYVYNNVFSSTGMQRNILNPLGYINNGSTNVLATNFSGNGAQYFLSDYYIQNASFLRMDNLNVGYDVGKILNKRANLRIGFNVQNLFVITKYKGIDPEINGGIDNNFYPRPRTYVLGANLNF